MKTTMIRYFFCALALIFAPQAYAEPDVRVYPAANHATFTRDTRNSQLGRAYRDDVHGLTWGEAVKAGAGSDTCVLKKMAYSEAKGFCESIGARLPTIHEYERLAISFGYGSASGLYYDGHWATEYFPDQRLLGATECNQNGRNEDFQGYWTSSEKGTNYRLTFYLQGMQLPKKEVSRLDQPHAVRCVLDGVSK